MVDPMDFPSGPVVGQDYTAPSGVVYTWNGYGWIIGYYDSETQDLRTAAGLIDQVRTLLQDTDNSSGAYRYSTDSIVAALNQGMTDLYRIRPDLFLELHFQIPVFNVGSLALPIGIEQQYIPPLIYYVVGLVQARDDEQNQDSRAMVFLKTFTQSVLSVS